MSYTKIVTEKGNHKAENPNAEEVIHALNKAEERGKKFVRFEGYGSNDDKHIKPSKVTMVVEK